MSKTVSLKVSSGMDSTLRVLTTLRRKQFDVSAFSMRELEDGRSELMLTLESAVSPVLLERAVQQLKKLADVFDLVEVVS